jgi:hypothetical protein
MSSALSMTTNPPGAERRAHARRRVEELPWVTSIRLKYGPPVSLIDLSPGGAQIDSASHRLQPGAKLIVEIASVDTRVAVRSEVVRCHVSAIAPHTVYRGAIAFERPLTWPDTSSPPLTTDLGTASPEDPGCSFVGWKRIVVRYDDGRVLRGFCRDFFPVSGVVDVWALPDAPHQARITVPVHHVRAIEFLSERLTSEPLIHAPIDEERSASTSLVVTFRDGKVMTGALENHEPEVGFFLAPVDTPNAESRTFVFSHAVDRLEWLPL